jgi:hypothetical protein
MACERGEISMIKTRSRNRIECRATTIKFSHLFLGQNGR